MKPLERLLNSTHGIIGRMIPRTDMPCAEIPRAKVPSTGISVGSVPRAITAGQAKSRGILTGPILTGPILMARALTAGAALMLLVFGGCGHDEYQDSYPVASGVIVDGGESSTSADLPADQDLSADQRGTILFVASPGGGKPPRLIARTNSITTAPTAEFLAREAIASRQGVPAPGNKLATPLVITADDDLATPISQTGSRLTISRQVGTDGGPTTLKIIEAP